MVERKSISETSCCPIASDPRVRSASDSQTDAIRDNFPTGLARPALRALVAAGFSSLDELVVISAQELAALHGMGPKGVRLLNEALQARGLALKA